MIFRINKNNTINKIKKFYLPKRGIANVDFRDIHLLNKFIDQHGRIMPRSRTNVSAKTQRKIEQAIKRSRIMGFMPFVQN